MPNSLQKKGYYTSSGMNDFGVVFDVKIKQISSASFSTLFEYSRIESAC